MIGYAPRFTWSLYLDILNTAADKDTVSGIYGRVLQRKVTITCLTLPSQKVPDQQRLNFWYKKGLEQGENRGLIKGYQEQNDEICSVTEHPYFERDLWTDIMEKVLDQKIPKRRTTINSSKNTQYDVTQNKIVLSKARQYLKDTKKVTIQNVYNRFTLIKTK